jgi:hypothetical protein
METLEDSQLRRRSGSNSLERHNSKAATAVFASYRSILEQESRTNVRQHVRVICMCAACVLCSGSDDEAHISLLRHFWLCIPPFSGLLYSVCVVLCSHGAPASCHPPLPQAELCRALNGAEELLFAPNPDTVGPEVAGGELMGHTVLPAEALTMAGSKRKSSIARKHTSDIDLTHSASSELQEVMLQLDDGSCMQRCWTFLATLSRRAMFLILLGCLSGLIAVAINMSITQLIKVGLKVCVRTYVRACVRACVRVCVWAQMTKLVRQYAHALLSSILFFGTVGGEFVQLVGWALYLHGLLDFARRLFHLSYTHRQPLGRRLRHSRDEINAQWGTSSRVFVVSGTIIITQFLDSP